MEYTCSECNAVFKNGVDFCAHFNDCHRRQNNYSIPLNNREAKKHKCSLCNYQSGRKSNLKRHEQSVHEKGILHHSNIHNENPPIENLQERGFNQNNSGVKQNHSNTNARGNKGIVITSNEEFGMSEGSREKYDIRLKENFKLFVSGPSRCGKTYFVSDIIENIRGFAKQPPSNIIYVYTVWQTKFDEMRSMIDYFVQDDGDITEKIKKMANGKPTLVVFDDLINSKSLSGIAKLFTVDARHMNLSLIFLSQRLFVNDEYFRQISQNSDYFAIFKNPRNSMEIRNLAQQMTPGSLVLVDIYMEATKNPFSYLFINVTQECPPRVKYLSSFFDYDYMVRSYVLQN